VAGAACSAPEAPNVVLVVIDTARADHLSAYGHSRETTPHLEEFARDAVTYRNVSAPSPWTLPSHASIFTGLPPGLHGLRWASDADRPGSGALVGAARPEAEERLLAELLRADGYTTIGISNNVWVSALTGLDSGFQHFWLLEDGGYMADYAQWREEHKVPARLADSSAGQSIALLKRALTEIPRQGPFFAFLNLIEPHFPYAPPDRFRGRLDGDPALYAELDQLAQDPSLELQLLTGAKKIEAAGLGVFYDEELRYVDATLGHLFRWLKQRGWYDDALIIVTSDHGEHLGEGGRYSHQLSVDEALLSVPLMIKYPGNRGGGGSEENSLVSATDVYWTVVSAVFGERLPVPPEPWSQDLARMEHFGRDWTLSEYYYSDRYLGDLARLNPDFDAARHKIVRRVVHTREGRSVFLGDELAPDLSANAGGEEARALPLPPDVREAYDRYVERVESLSSDLTVIDDPAALEGLRKLGYLQ